MSVIKEVADAVKGVAEGVEHIRTVAKAVRDGKNYLRAREPQVRQELATMCAEMQKTATAVAAASAIVTHFRFTVAGSGLAGTGYPPVPATLLQLSNMNTKGSICGDCGAKEIWKPPVGRSEAGSHL